jgi:hypothetical protein
VAAAPFFLIQVKSPVRRGDRLTTAPDLPSRRDLLIHLLGLAESANAAAKRLHRWLQQRIEEEQRNWDECVQQELPDTEVFAKLAKWGITIEGWDERFDQLTDVNNGQKT